MKTLVLVILSSVGIAWSASADVGRPEHGKREGYSSNDGKTDAKSPGEKSDSRSPRSEGDRRSEPKTNPEPKAQSQSKASIDLSSIDNSGPAGVSKPGTNGAPVCANAPSGNYLDSKGNPPASSRVSPADPGVLRERTQAEALTQGAGSMSLNLAGKIAAEKAKPSAETAKAVLDIRRRQAIDLIWDSYQKLIDQSDPSKDAPHRETDSGRIFAELYNVNEFANKLGEAEENAENPRDDEKINALEQEKARIYAARQEAAQRLRNLPSP